MSTLLVPVAQIENLRIHPNASMLAICDILGWQMVVPLRENSEGQFVREFVKEDGKDVPFDAEKHVGLEKFSKKFSFSYANGDKVVYFPIDTLIPAEWADKWNIRKYLQGKEKDRVGRIQLRGEPSFGLAVALPEGQNWDVGTNVADFYGAKKYEPPIRPLCGDADTPHPLLEGYTEIENMRNYPTVFCDGEEVIVTEKIHGTSCRVAVLEGVHNAGSMSLRRKKPETEEAMKTNLYWMPWTLPTVKALLEGIYAETGAKQIILYGETYGCGVQKNFVYGLKNAMSFRAFDLKVGGKYLDYDDFKNACDKYGVEVAPILYRGPFSLAKIKEVSEGNTTLTEQQQIREGTVTKPAKERTDPRIGRVVLKYLSNAYLLLKGISDYTEV
jgi:RNA ligase (TIGR02306 family)